MKSLDDLLRDPETARCYAAFTGAKQPVLDDYIACYGTEEPRIHSRELAAAIGVPFEDESVRVFSEGDSVSDDKLLAQLRERLGVKTSTSDGDSERVAEPRFADPSDERWDRYLRDSLCLAPAERLSRESGA